MMERQQRKFFKGYRKMIDEEDSEKENHKED
jgi:hypothetical protein